MTDLFAANLAALAERSPDTARQVRRPASDSPFRPAFAADGQPIVEFGGRPLESRRAPADAARRQAATITAPRVAVVGFGAGYLVEALLRAGHEVGVIVESDPEAVAAALGARDLRHILGRVPLVLTGALQDPVELVLLKSRVPAIAPLGARVTTDERLARIVASWPKIPAPGRRPRVLLVGPIYGGSLETARSTARALTAAGAETTFLDFSPFASGWSAFEAMTVPLAGQKAMQSGLGDLLGQAVLRQAAVLKPDLVLAMAQAPLSMSVLGQLRGAGIRTAFWFVENWRVLPYWKEVAVGYDVFFAIQGQPFLDQVRAAGAEKAVYLPTACDPERHLPVTLTAGERLRYAAQVSFAGAPYLNRRRLLAAMGDYELKLWGEGWEQTELARFAVGSGHRFSLDEMVRVFAGSQINLNIHAATHVDGLDPDPDYLNPRTFELAACGAFQLVDAREPLADAFSADEVVSFRTVPELRGQVEYFLARPAEREAMAARARTRALAAHTFIHRIRRILVDTVGAASAAAALLENTGERLCDAIDRMERADPSMIKDEALLRVLRELEPKS